MVYSLACISLGLNFLFLNPTFNPLDIPKWTIGAIFTLLGLSELIFLNVPVDNTRKTIVRILMALIIGVMFFWAGALTIDFFERSQTSLQLPITYLVIAFLGIATLLEPTVNPITNKNGPVING